MRDIHAISIGLLIKKGICLIHIRIKRDPPVFSTNVPEGYFGLKNRVRIPRVWANQEFTVEAQWFFALVVPHRGLHTVLQVLGKSPNTELSNTSSWFLRAQKNSAWRILHTSQGKNLLSSILVCRFKEHTCKEKSPYGNERQLFQLLKPMSLSPRIRIIVVPVVQLRRLLCLLSVSYRWVPLYWNISNPKFCLIWSPSQTHLLSLQR